MISLDKISYLATGVIGVVSQRPRCPSCKCVEQAVASVKIPYRLLSCQDCGLRYRFPIDSARWTEKYYQTSYNEPGLTTELPNDEELRLLVDCEFIGTSKSFRRVIEILAACGIPPGAKILDFGANWGYGAWQLKNAGFAAYAYELSRARAEFGKQIGINIATSLDKIPNNLDVCYSSHVLEHIQDPAVVIEAQLRKVRPGGYVIAHTPNGSNERLHDESARKSFRKHWGQRHPVLLSGEFIQQLAGQRPSFLATEHLNVHDGRPEPPKPRFLSNLGKWDRNSSYRSSLVDDELFFIIRRPE